MFDVIGKAWSVRVKLALEGYGALNFSGCDTAIRKLAFHAHKVCLVGPAESCHSAIWASLVVDTSPNYGVSLTCREACSHDEREFALEG